MPNSLPSTNAFESASLPENSPENSADSSADKISINTASDAFVHACGDVYSCLPGSMLAPDDIEARSFAIIDAEIQPHPFSGHAWEVARRLVHTSGDVTLPAELLLPDSAVASGVAALLRGTMIFTDTRMACAGIPARRLAPLGCSAACLTDLPGVTEKAAAEGVTRSRAAMLLAAPRLAGSIVAIGNAPTALLTLLELLAQGLPAPALIVGMPVGFVNAAESKALLEQSPWHALILRGRRGGSPLVAAAVNALAVIAGRKE